jgi:hypothetical protein
MYTWVCTPIGILGQYVCIHCRAVICICIVCTAGVHFLAKNKNKKYSNRVLQIKLKTKPIPGQKLVGELN